MAIKQSNKQSSSSPEHPRHNRRRYRHRRRRRLVVLLQFDRRIRTLLLLLLLLISSIATLLLLLASSRSGTHSIGGDGGSSSLSLAVDGEGGTTPVPCAPYGCPVYVPEYDSDPVQRHLDAIRQRRPSNPNPSLNGRLGNGGNNGGNGGNGGMGEGKGEVDADPPYGTTRMAGLSRRCVNRKPANVNQDRGVLILPFGEQGARAAGVAGGGGNGGGGSGGSNGEGGTKDGSGGNGNGIIIEEDFFLGVFDGHGDNGQVVSDYVARELPRRLSDKLKAAADAPDIAADDGDNLIEEEEILVQRVKRALIESFLEVDQDVPPSGAMNGGCTASVVLKHRTKLYFANAGDSRSFVATYDPSSTATQDVNIVHITRRDKPNLPSEKQRIEALGGKIHIPPPPKNPDWSRVIVHSSVKREDVGLAMSRSIGDWEWSVVGVVAEPIVDVVDLRDLLRSAQQDGGGGVQLQSQPIQILVASASDGLLDKRKPEFVAKHLAGSFFGGGGNTNEDEEEGKGSGGGGGSGVLLHPLLACEDLILSASPDNPSWYRDDITVLAIKVST